MKKKIILFVSVLTCMISLVACGTDPTTVDYNGYSYAQLEMTAQSMGASLEELTDQECQEYYDYYSQQEDGAVYAGMLESWNEIKPETGDFVGYSDFTVDKAGKTLSASLIMDYSTRDVKLTYVFNAHSMEVQAINVELVYTLGETMQKAALNTFMGIGTVFLILILISLVIYAFNLIPYLQKKFGRAAQDEDKKVVVAQREEAAVNATDDLELVAVIAAAIAASTGASTDDFVVRSIKRR